MQNVNWKKLLYIFIPAVLIFGAAYFLIWKPQMIGRINEKPGQDEVQNADKYAQSEAGKEIITEENQTQNMQADDAENNTEGREIIGTITSVYETEDPNYLLVDISADVVAGDAAGAQKVQNTDGVEGAEVPVKNKQYEISVAKNTPVQNGTIDGLNEDDFVRIVTKEDINSGTDLSAVSLEEL